MSQRWRRNLGKRTVGGLAIFAAGWLIYIGVMNWLIWRSATDWGERDQILRSVLQPLPDTTIAPIGPTRITRFGYSLNAPWKELQSEKDVKFGDFLSFKDGDNLLVWNPEEAVGTVKTMRGKTASENQLMRSVFGGKALTSNYDFMSAALMATPDEVHWWSGRRRNLQLYLLLMNKGTTLHRSDVFYAQRSQTLQGFQLGDAGISPYVVTLELFDSRDRHYTIWISGQNKQPPKITQSEINAMVDSITPVS